MYEFEAKRIYIYKGTWRLTHHTCKIDLKSHAAPDAYTVFCNYFSHLHQLNVPSTFPNRNSRPYYISLVWFTFSLEFTYMRNTCMVQEQHMVVLSVNHVSAFCIKLCVCGGSHIREHSHVLLPDHTSLSLLILLLSGWGKDNNCTNN